MDIQDVQLLLNLIDRLLSQSLTKGFNKDFLLLQQELTKLYTKYPDLKIFNQRFNKCKKQQEYIVVLSELQEYILEELTQPKIQSATSTTLTTQQYFPSFITVNQTVLGKIKEGIKNDRVRKKLVFIFDNLENSSFLKKVTKNYYRDSYIDLSCITDIVRQGVVIRIPYFVEDGKFRLCDLFLNHDEYEKAITSGRYLKHNFQRETWLPLPHF